MSSALSTYLGPVRPRHEPDFISADSVYWIRVFMDFLLQVIILLFGVCTNIINLRVFTLIGVKDSVTVSFFALSTAHLGYNIINLLGRVIYSLGYIFLDSSEDNYKALAYLVTYYGNLFQDVAVAVIVFTAVQKCCCVAIPFRFKDMFTLARSALTVAAIYIFAITYYLPVFIGQRFGAVQNPITNRTFLTYLTFPYTLEHFQIWRILTGMVFPVVSQAMVILCLIILTVKLKEATRFRLSSPNSNANEQTSALFSGSVGQSGKPAASGHASGKTRNKFVERNGRPETKYRLKGKELRVVQAVYATAVLFVAGNIGKIPVRFLSVLLPEFIDYPRSFYYNTFTLVSAIQSVMTDLESTSHIGVYLKFNKKYRSQFAIMSRQLKPSRSE